MEQDGVIREGCDDVPEIDEGWWSSILGDEGSYAEDSNNADGKLGLQPAVGALNWDCVKELYDHDEVVLLNVHGFNRGGLLVQGDCIQGFVPVSHLIDMPSSISYEQRHNLLSEYIGKSLYLKVIECEPSCDRVVLSERAAQAGEGKRKELFESLSAGSIINGVVTNITDFGAFIDLGGVEGLIHVSELSWGRVDKPDKFLTVGQQVRVMVLTVNAETSRIALSLKRLTANPWEELIKKYTIGDTVEAHITSILKFGAFAKLEEGVEGLIHVSCIAQGNDHPNLQKMFVSGQKVTVRILHIDAERRRLGLGLVVAE